MAGDGLVGREVRGFDVIETIGRGAFATVYRARQLRLGRDVALKVLDPTLARDPQASGRFEREGWAAAGLDHPNIVPVYEAGEDDGVYYLAMRLVSGESLAAVLERAATTNAFPLTNTAGIVAAVAGALDHAHARGVLHRDVKPANILLDDERVWLTDFGIAATARDAGTYTTGALGTAMYMAPEQSKPGEADHRADLYSMGCVVYECVTGRPPFMGSGIPELLYAHSYEPVPSVGDEGLDGFFSTALAKDPSDRFESGAALIDALTAVLGGVPSNVSPSVVAPPPPTVSVDTRSSRRLWLGIAAAAVVLAAVLVFLLASSADNPDPSSPSSSSSSSIDANTRNQAAIAYSSAVASVNAAQVEFRTRAEKWDASTSAEQAVADAKTFLDAVVAVQPKLSEIAEQYPPAADNVLHDVAAVAALQRHLLSLQNLNAGTTVADWQRSFVDHIQALMQASDAVRADLGLEATAN